MKNYIKTLICFILFASCGQTNETSLDQWELGSSNDDMLMDMTTVDMVQMKENAMNYLEVVWKYTKGNNNEKVFSWAEGIRDRAKETGITVSSIHLPYGGIYDISQVSDSARMKAVEANISDMETASRILKPSYFVIHPSAEPIEDEERAARFESSRKSLQELAKVAKRLNMSLLVENLPRTCLGRDSNELLSLIDSIDNTYVCFDVNHLLSESQSEFIANVGNKIKGTHISDYDRVNERHWMPKEGVIDWPRLLDDLLKVGYKGPFIYEVSQTDPPLSIKQLADNWKLLKEEHMSKSGIKQ